MRCEITVLRHRIPVPYLIGGRIPRSVMFLPALVSKTKTQEHRHSLYQVQINTPISLSENKDTGTQSTRPPNTSRGVQQPLIFPQPMRFVQARTCCTNVNDGPEYPCCPEGSTAPVTSHVGSIASFHTICGRSLFSYLQSERSINRGMYIQSMQHLTRTSPSSRP